MAFKTTVFIAAALGAGAGLGWLVRDMNMGTQTPAASESHPFAAPAAFASTRDAPSIDLEQVRRVVREELYAAQANRTANTSAPAAKPPTPELIAKRRAAVDEIETMIRSGDWGNEQRATFHQHMAMLDPEQAERLLREVTIAFNQGAMRVTTDGPPL